MNTLNLILSLSGLLSCVLTPLILRICWKRNSYSIKRNTLSDCGSSIPSARLFTFGLAIFGILEVDFTYEIIKNLLPVQDMWILIPALVGGLLTIMVAVFDNHRFPKLHEFFSYMIFILLILWCVGLHIMILQNNFTAGIVGLSISAILGIGISITRKVYGECAIPEIFFISGVMVWNLYFSYVILMG